MLKIKIEADKKYKGNFEVIFHPQNKDNIEFDYYYNKYQMKYLIVVSNPNNIIEESENSLYEDEEEKEKDNEKEKAIHEDLFLEIITKDNKKKVVKEKEFKWEDDILYSLQLRQPKKKKIKD